MLHILDLIADISSNYLECLWLITVPSTEWHGYFVYLLLIGKEVWFFLQVNNTQCFIFLDSGQCCRSVIFIPDPNFFHPGSGPGLFTHPGSWIQGVKKAPDLGSRIRNTGSGCALIIAALQHGWAPLLVRRWRGRRRSWRCAGVACRSSPGSSGPREQRTHFSGQVLHWLINW